MSNYIKLTNNLELLKLENIKENIDVTLANAILDRLLHHSHIININGNSYRLKNKLKIDSESSETI